MAAGNRLKRVRETAIPTMKRSAHSCRRRTKRLTFEPLEDRHLLATLFTPKFGAEATTFVPGIDTAEPLSSVPLEFVFWGGNYWSTSTGQQEQTQILNAAQTICNSGFFKDEAAEYDTDGKLHVDVSDVDLTNPSNGFSQSQLNGIFQNAIDNGPLPESDNSNFGQAEYIVVTPPGVYSASGPTVGGYNTGTAHTHNFNIVSENFIWVGGGNSGTFNLDTYTTTLSHEVAELTVNPVAYEVGTGTYRFGWEVNPGASFPNPPGNSNQICDYEAQNYTARLLGVDVQSYWSQTNQAFIIPDNNTQNFYVNNGVLTLQGNQNGILSNSFSVETTSAGDFEADMNGESVVFDPGEITSVRVFGGSGGDSLHVGSGILGVIPVTFGTHVIGQPFVFNGNQLTVQGQLGTSNNDAILLAETDAAGSLEAKENGDTVTFGPGEINGIHLNLGSGSDSIHITSGVPAIVQNIVFTNVGTPGIESLAIDSDNHVTNPGYVVGASPNGSDDGSVDPFSLYHAGWQNLINYPSNFHSVTLAMAGSTGESVSVEGLPAATTLNIDLGLGNQAVQFGDIHGTSSIHGNVNISDDPNPGSSSVGIVVDDVGATASRDITLKNEFGQPGWGSITGFGSSGLSEVDYQYSAGTTLAVDSDAAIGNSINVFETGVATSVQIDAVTYVYLGDTNVGTQDLLGSVSLSSNESGTPDEGNAYLTINDAADAAVRTITLSTFTPIEHRGSLFFPDTNWGSISGLTPSPATISYEYADTNSVTILGNPADQIVNHQTGSGQTPVTLNSSPVVTGVSPNQGPISGGTVVTITGTGLGGSPGVFFGNTEVYPDPSFTNTATTLHVIAPNAAAAGAVDIQVIDQGGLSQKSPADLFTYTGVPAVTSVSPSAGPLIGNTLVTITGTNLGGATAVKFGQTAGMIVSDTGTQIQADDPSASAGTVDVKVTTPGGTSAASSADKFTYTGAPVVSAVNPWQSGLAGGVQVSILGSGLSDVTEVDFGSTKVTNFTIVSATQIDVISPPGAAGTVDVTVVGGGSRSPAVPGDQYTYIAAPSVSSLSPKFGPYEGGTTVTINGANLGTSVNTVVRFGTTVATIVSDTGSQIVATSPIHAVGIVDVTVSTTGGTSPIVIGDEFDFVFATPVVNSISPSSGLPTGGTSVTITGNYFEGTTQVSFGGTPAASFIVNSDTQIIAVSPAGTAGSHVEVTVVAHGLQSVQSSQQSPPSTADYFTYAPVPSVTSLSPSTGPVAGGTTVTITGLNLGARRKWISEASRARLSSPRPMRSK